MTRKDFELIAQTIKQLSPAARKEAAILFAAALVATNPRFNAQRFVDDCGVA